MTSVHALKAVGNPARLPDPPAASEGPAGSALADGWVRGHPEEAWRTHLRAGVERWVGSTGLTLPAVWAEQARRAPHQPILRESGSAWWSASELHERSGAVEAVLAGSGLRPGDRVLLEGRTSATVVAAYLGILRAGMVAVPFSSALSEAELAYVAADSGATYALVLDAATAGLVEAATRGAVRTLPAAEVAVRRAGSPGDDDGATAGGARPSDPALLCYTSGTTGAPKGVLLSHANLVAGASALHAAWDWTAEDRLVLSLPLFHLHGLGVGVNGTLLCGASAVLLPRFDVDAVASVAREPGVTLFFGVPTMYTRLLRASRMEDLRRLRVCVSGSAPLSAELHRALQEASGQTVLERYGMSETLMLTSNPLVGDRRAGTVGFALPGVEVRLRSDDPSASGTPGEILVRGPNVFARYWNRPSETTAAFDGEGWFSTGDVGQLDAAGYLRIVGRIKDLIISGGENVGPFEVEEALRRHPVVVDAAVVGVPSDDWGEEVVAFVVADGPVAADELALLCARSLAPYKRPKRILLLDELPRNAMGKIVRDALREMVR